MCDAIEQSKFIKLGCKPPLSGDKYAFRMQTSKVTNLSLLLTVGLK